MKKKVLALLCAFVLCLTAAACSNKNETPQQSEAAPKAEETAPSTAEAAAETTAAPAVFDDDVLVYQGESYPMRKHLWSVLLMGTDSKFTYEEDNEAEKDFRSYHQADFLTLLVVDKDANAVNVIQLNRDTMADVPWLDIFGEFGGTEYKQICRAFNYGDGGVSSCRNTLHAVSMLLFDAPIDGYIQMPMTEIGTLNDLVGGVPVTFTDDLTIIDPFFVQGKTLTLKGEQAEKFIRARNVLPDDTNISRMRRHRDYFDSFEQCAKEALQNDPDFPQKMLKVMEKVIQTNLSTDQIVELLRFLDKCQVNPVLVPDGDLQLGEKFYEFYLDENSLWDAVSTAYCE